MKDVNRLKDYRAKYKRYYNIDFDSDYVIHHIDFDRSNNDIKNLLLLPKELHQRYHFYLSAMCGSDWKSGKVEMKTKISYDLMPYTNDEYIYGFLETVKECRKWLQYKDGLDIKKELSNYGCY